MRYPAIDRFGVIGNMDTVALVGMDGSIDFMCFPFFDSPSIFARLVDRDRGGSFSIAPRIHGEVTRKQMYLPDTNVLFTRFLSPDGVAEISDYMPLEPDQHRVVRRAKTIRGELTFDVFCNPRMGYAREEHTVEVHDREAVFASKNLALRLRASVPLAASGSAATARFVLRANESATFILEEATRDSPSVHPHYAADAFKHTADYWRAWVARSTYRGRWREDVNRSALVLKLLTSRRHGSIVAAPTFGLPEDIGGERNWDYRYTWIRDGSFTLYGLMRLGHTDEAAHFMKWLEDRCVRSLNIDGSLQVLYGIDGRRDLEEEVLGHFEGYRGSRPVRIGNNAYKQLQLDMYGELMDSIYLYDKYGEPISYDLWSNLVKLVDWVCKNWRQPDEGIWEVRGGKREFLLSRVMCWTAIDRAMRLATRRSFPAPYSRWRSVRDEIYQEIYRAFWDSTLGAFVQYEGAATTDASTLLMPLVRFISPTDPRWLSTLKAIERELVDDSHVYRYRYALGAVDGMHGHEGTFCICSFWYAECLARAGDLDQARYVFEKMLGYANHLGLFPEELGKAGEPLGNFPQALTHIGLISVAYYLDRELSKHDRP